MTYETNMDAVMAALITQIKTVTDFSDRVYQGYFRKITTYPTCLVMPVRDRIDRGGIQSFHHMTFQLAVFFRGGANTPEDDIDDFIELIGAVYDALEAKETNAPTWQLLTVEDLDYAMGREKSLLFYLCVFTINCRKRW